MLMEHRGKRIILIRSLTLDILPGFSGKISQAGMGVEVGSTCTSLVIVFIMGPSCVHGRYGQGFIISDIGRAISSEERMKKASSNPTSTGPLRKGLL